MNKFLATLGFIIAIVIGILFFPEGAVAAVLCFALSIIAIALIRSFKTKLNTQEFLISVFLGGLFVRVVVASIIYGLELQDNMGPDANYYDFMGNKIAEYWHGTGQLPKMNTLTSGWGMHYFVGVIYFVVGQNPLAGQLVVGVFGAFTSVIGFFCARDIFNNERVAKYSALFIAFFPSMIIWTSQLLKDGLIIFLLLLIFLAAMRLQKKFNYLSVIILFLSFGALFSLRFYVFFIVIGAVVGGFALSRNSSGSNIAKRFAVCVIIGVAFAFAGVWNVSQEQTDMYFNLDQIQRSREFAADAANSGFSEEIDVRTTEGVLTAIPLGLVTLYLAPFPWQVTNITQLLTMPEMFVWWLSLPLIISGVIYSIKNKFREALPILFFTLVLSLSYSIYQGNLGTLYRQRAQIQVLLLIFASVGVVVKIEERENKRLILKRRNSHNQILSYK